MVDTAGKLIPPPPMQATHVVVLDRTGNSGPVSAWDFPLDLGIERPNMRPCGPAGDGQGALTEYGRNDAAKVRALVEKARRAGRYVR